MGLHNEIQFETDICHHLGAHGWAHVIGEVLKSRDEAGRLRIKVVELKHRHGY